MNNRHFIGDDWVKILQNNVHVITVTKQIVASVKNFINKKRPTKRLSVKENVIISFRMSFQQEQNRHRYDR